MPNLDVLSSLLPMTGRDPHQPHRVATPLELLLDLTFVVAFGVAGNEFAHAIAENHVAEGMGGFIFATFAIIWAWINFSWFASAFDTDDWLYRLTTMVQMVGVVILALGLPALFKSLGSDHLDNRVMVAGYIVMRVAMLLQWGRVAATDPEYRRTALTYITTISVAQVGWTILAWVDTPLWVALVVAALLQLIELLGPAAAEMLKNSTPWHAHHIAERYGLLAIIALGEGVIGTVASVSATVEEHGWSFEAVAVVVAGIGLTFGMWWTYFVSDFGSLLHANRKQASKTFAFGYGHIPIFMAIAAVGAGLHVAAYVIEGKAEISNTLAVASVAMPVLVYVVAGVTLYNYMAGALDLRHLLLLLGTVAVLALSLVLAAVGVPIGVCLLVVMMAPWVEVIGVETFGWLEGHTPEPH